MTIATVDASKAKGSSESTELANQFVAGPVVMACFVSNIQGSSADRSGYPPLKTILSPRELEAFRRAMARVEHDPKSGAEVLKGEVVFSGLSDLRRARAEFEAWLDADPVSKNLLEGAHLGRRYGDASTEYVEAMLGKVGIRNLRVDGDTAFFDVVRVPFPAYQLFSKPGIGPDMLNFCSVTGVGMIPVSRDGYMIMQIRSDRNAAYGNVAGVGVSGMLDATRRFDLASGRRVPGGPDSIDNGTFFAGMIAESRQEIGLQPQQLSEVTITGISRDLTKPHDEITAIGVTFLSAAQHLKQSVDNQRANLDTTKHFAETAFAIPGSPEAIREYFENVHNPLPPTHAAGLIAAGRSFLRGRNSTPDEIRNWEEQMATVVGACFHRIDQTVAAHYRSNPESLFVVPERFSKKLDAFAKGLSAEQQVSFSPVGALPAFERAFAMLPDDPQVRARAIVVMHAVLHKVIPERNASGYSADYWPEEQGLPDIRSELRRCGYLQ